MKKINVLSCFGGIEAGRLALELNGTKINKYYSSEIDKFAMAVAQYHYPDTIQLGDITKWREWDIDYSEIDLIMGGFPCQSWSFSGKQLGVKDPRGQLVHDLIAIWKHVTSKNPDVYFLFENVKMKKEFMNYLDGLFGIDHILINSALVSAQNRQRLYWTNIPNIAQPENEHIYLKDIIESGDVDRDKSLAVLGSVGRSTRKRYEERSAGQIVYTGAAIRGRYNEDGKIEQRLELNNIEKSNALTTQTNTSLLCIQTGEADIKGHDSMKRTYSVEGKSPTVTTCGGGNTEPKITTSETTWRKLTPVECERLQTFPDNYTLVPWKNRMMSNTQRYKQCGNSFTVEVISHILKNAEF